MLSNWKEPYGDRRQEIVLIGTEDTMDESYLTKCFDACLLTDEEMEAGDIYWSIFKDPFPEWIIPEQAMPAEIE